MIKELLSAEISVDNNIRGKLMLALWYIVTPVRRMITRYKIARVRRRRIRPAWSRWYSRIVPPEWHAVPPGKPRLYLKKIDWAMLPFMTVVSWLMIWIESGVMHAQHNYIVWIPGFLVLNMTWCAFWNWVQMRMYRRIEAEAEQRDREWEERHGKVVISANAPRDNKGK